MEFCLDAVTKTYTEKNGVQIQALAPLTKTVAPGEFVALIGPSGCGKSTLLYLAAGLLLPTSGRLYWRGAQKQPHTAMVFQQGGLFPWLTVAENVAFSLQDREFSQQEITERVAQKLARMQLSEFADAYPGSLSGGMRQRVGIARALVTEPDLLLMDEPFSALDAQTRRLLEDDLVQYWEELRPATLYVTHNIAEAVRLADVIWVFSPRPGRIVECLTVDIPRKERHQLSARTQLAALEETIWQEIKAGATAALTQGGRHDD